jgi:hypothetical protein
MRTIILCLSLFSFTISSFGQEVTLSADTNLHGGVALGGITPTGSGTRGAPWVYSFTSGGLDLNGYKLYSQNQPNNSESITLNLGGEDITGGGSIETFAGESQYRQYRASGFITITNVGSVTCHLINSKCDPQSIKKDYYSYAGQVKIGSAADPAGNVTVGNIHAHADRNWPMQAGTGDEVLIYSTGDVLIESGGVVGDILTRQFTEGDGNEPPSHDGQNGIKIRHGGTFKARSVDARHAGEQNSNDHGYEIILNGDYFGNGISGSCTVSNLMNQFGEHDGAYDYQYGIPNDPIKVLNYTSVHVQGDINGSSEDYWDGTAGSDLFITNITGDITIDGTITLNSTDSHASDGTMTLQTTGSGAIRVNDLNLTNLVAKFDSASGVSYVDGVLSNFAGANDPRLRAPSGQTVFYQQDQNPSLGGLTYGLVDLDGTGGAGGELKPEAPQGTVVIFK